MRKIASPQDLQTELAQLLAYAQQVRRPKRAIIASRLRSIAHRVALQQTPFRGQIKQGVRKLLKEAKDSLLNMEESNRQLKLEFDYWDDELGRLLEKELGKQVAMTLSVVVNEIRKRVGASSYDQYETVEALGKDLKKRAKARAAEHPTPAGMTGMTDAARYLEMVEDMGDNFENIAQNALDNFPDFARMWRQLDQLLMAVETLVKTDKDRKQLDSFRHQSDTLRDMDDRNGHSISFLRGLVNTLEVMAKTYR